MSAPEKGRERVHVAILGATGIVGQHLVRILAGHPWLEVTEVFGSERRRGLLYGDATDWVVTDDPPEVVASLALKGPDEEVCAPVVLSALPAEAARRCERRLADAGHLVCTNASAHRMDDDVPLVVPEVNPASLDHHLSRGRGLLIANPNCVVTGLALALAPIERTWGIESGTVVTLQALSGAGLSGPTGLTALGNVVPWIEGEEEKIEQELGKVLGCRAPLAIAVNRVPVHDGHLAHVFLRLRRKATPEHVVEALEAFRPEEAVVGLPSIPSRPLVVRHEPDRPQPRRDAGAGSGMSVSVGRVRSTGLYDVAFTVVSNNTVRGAAGACIANAELAMSRGMLRQSSGSWTAP